MTKLFRKESYIFFVLTYVFVGLWLYKGVSQTYSFCLSSRSFFNIYGLLAGVAGVLVIPSYIKHQKGAMRLLGIFTLVLGLSAVIIVCYRFFSGSTIC